MQNKGVYYSKLIKIFSTITLALSLIVFTMLALFLLNIEQKDKHMLKSALDVHINASASALNYITESINRFSADSTVLKWCKADINSPEYYFNALKIYQMLREESVYQNYLNIDISLTTDNPEAFVISPSGTIKKELFDIVLNRVVERPETHPVYNGENLDGVMLITPRAIDNSNLIIISSFSLPEEIIESPYFEIAIMDENRNEIFGSNTNFNNVLKDNYRSASEFKAEDFQCYTISWPEFGFTMIYGYTQDSLTLPICILIFSFLIILLLFILIFSKITKSLYKPVQMVVSQIQPTNDSDSNDEFAIIKNNCHKIEHLNKELEKALEEQSMLEEQQKYRSFIKGLPTPHLENDISSAFTVAVVMPNADSVNTNMLFAELDTYSKNTPHLHTVRTYINEVALIQKADTIENGIFLLTSTITRFITSQEKEIDIKFAIADSIIGYNKIPEAYQNAQEIIQYRYKVKNKIILTKQDIDEKVPKLSFSFQDENKLISMLLAGKPEALDIYDKIIDTNISKNLLPNELNKLAYMMIGIANRLFQELKDEPEKMLGYNINWNRLYANKNTQQTLESIRNILKSTIDSRQNIDKEEDNKMIKAMKEYINQHYMENIMLVDLSAAFNLTPKYCSSIFNQLSKDNFKNYLNNLRIQKAKEMIEEDPEIKISYLSHKIGFSSANTFIRVFNKYVGITPKLFADKIIKGRKENGE